MANENKPFGLRSVGSMNGAPVNAQVRKFFVPDTDATAIYNGDTVKLAGSQGKLFPDDALYPTATKAATGDAVVGVVVGVEPLPGDLETRYRKASTAMYVFVETDPDALFEIQGDADVFDPADVGLNMSITVSTGEATTGVSNAVADQSTAAATATLALQVIGVSPKPDNDVSGGYPLLVVKLNNHQYTNATTGL